MRLLHVDDETIDLLANAAMALEAALSARAARVDPNGILSRSYEMSRIKTDEAIRQLRRPKPMGWEAYPVAQRANLLMLCGVLLDEKQTENHPFALRKLRAACFLYPEQADTIPSGEPPESGSIRDITMEADAAYAALGTPALHAGLRKDRKPTASPKTPRKRRKPAPE